MDYEARVHLERMLHDESAEPSDLPVSILKVITNNFSDDHIIGHGGFAVVYKGLLANGAVAVKKLSNSICMDEERYDQEVTCLMRMKHKNIVRFLGYCADTQRKMSDYEGKFVMADERERLLCFEYLPKGILRDYITDASHGLEWRKRYRIIKGICEGLHYLHDKRIVHLDLKPTNILLDENMVPKIADFGISRCFDEGQSWAITSKLVGTTGYLAPEFYSRKITFKLDIYSLGVIITEILTGQKGYSSVENVLESWRNRLKTSAVDSLLEQVRVCTEISIDCMNFNPDKRPVTQCIIEMLDETESMDESNQTDDERKRHIIEMLDETESKAESNQIDDGRKSMDKYDETDLQKGLFTIRNNNKDSKLQNTTIEPAVLTLRLLEEITDGFSEERMIGGGTNGKIYRGVSKNGEAVAVKVLFNDWLGCDERFHNEFQNYMRFNHPNIVRLVGYCYETQHEHVDFEGKIVFAERRYRALCFEYLQNGSLQMHLADESDGLDWLLRYKIIKGTCEGLKYLHKECKEPVYHLDLKPGHILLDRNMIPKLADFATSNVFHEEQTMIMESPIGTIGYLSPEYIESNIVSNKLDMYALGVIMIKIIAGPRGHLRNAETPPQEFIDIVQGNWRKRLQTTWSGSSLEAYCEQVKRCTEIALNCMEIDRHKRPNIVDITNKMNETETVIDQLKNDQMSPMD